MIEPTAILYLVASLILMALVPSLSRYLEAMADRHIKLYTAINWGISLTILFHILPEAYAFAGLVAPVVASLGFLSSLIFDAAKITRFLIHTWVFPFIVLGLGLHGILDGLVIRLVDSPVYITGTAPIVVFHRLTAGLFIWVQLEKELGKRYAYLVYSLLAAAFLFGFFSSRGIQTFIVDSRIWVGSLQALLAGGVLHAAFHKSVTHDDEHH
ncbi:MAG: hypothetical protein WCI18_05515 [Pseudomonadota bacterium]